MELSLTTTLKKMLVTAAQVVLSIGIGKASTFAQSHGIPLGQDEATIASMTLLRGLSNILKTKWPRFFSWL